MKLHLAIAALALHATLPRAAATQEPIATRPVHIPPVIDTTAMDDSATAAAAAAADSRPNCWRAQRSPPCPGFFLTDVGLDYPMHYSRRGNSTGARDPEIRLLWSVGFMGTKGRHSHGGVATLVGEDLDGDHIPWMLEYRYRNWLTRSAAVDAGIGYKSTTLWHGGRGDYVHAGGPTMLLAFTPSRWIGVSLRYDLANGPGVSQRMLSVGAQSTRGSEYLFRFTAIALWRAALGAIGIEVDDEEQ